MFKRYLKRNIEYHQCTTPLMIEDSNFYRQQRQSHSLSESQPTQQHNNWDWMSASPLIYKIGKRWKGQWPRRCMIEWTHIWYPDPQGPPHTPPPPPPPPPNRPGTPPTHAAYLPSGSHLPGGGGAGGPYPRPSQPEPLRIHRGLKIKTRHFMILDFLQAGHVYGNFCVDNQKSERNVHF